MTLVKFFCRRAWLCQWAISSLLAAWPVLAFPADYRDTPQSKLDAATLFVAEFLVRDALPTEVFFQRKMEFPTWKDSPMIDCELNSFVRAIEQRGQPYFEDTKQEVVSVPVVAELLMVDAGQAGGPNVRPGIEGYSWCSFEYERYNFQTKRFEKLPEFRKHTLNIEFKTWGDVLPRWRSAPLPPGIEDSRYVAIALDKRYVRYVIRVNVSREAPYRIWPQVPRHWLAKDAIAKLEMLNKKKMELLQRKISDRDERATGEALTKDLQRMARQLEQDRWQIDRLRERLVKLDAIESFSDLSATN